MKVRELISLIEADGWFQVRMKGSHRQFHHPTKAGTVTRIGEAERRHTAWNAEQRTKASRSKEAGVIFMRYLVIVEKGPTSYGAHVPDLPGCIAAGETKEEVLLLIREAIEFHLEDLKQEGQPIPSPASTSELVEVEAA